MNNNLTICQTAQWLKEYDNYLILTHIRPDGDTLGCAGALARALRITGKTAYVLNNPETAVRYNACLDGCRAPENYIPEHIVTVDTSTTQLLPGNALVYANIISLCIDHHKSNSMNAKNVCCYPDYASCGEIIYAVLEQIGVFRCMVNDSGEYDKMKQISDCLYVAVSTDTGCFAYGNTTANTHAVAARLIELGASAVKINKELFRTKTRERVTLEGLLYSSLEYYFSGMVAIMTISLDMMKLSGATEDDIEDVANIPVSVEGVCIGITIRELSAPDDCKISVRSTDGHRYDASALCARYGGGGHLAAAGATINKTAEKIKKDLLAELESWKLEIARPGCKPG